VRRRAHGNAGRTGRHDGVVPTPVARRRRALAGATERCRPIGRSAVVGVRRRPVCRPSAHEKRRRNLRAGSCPRAGAGQRRPMVRCPAPARRSARDPCWIARLPVGASVAIRSARRAPNSHPLAANPSARRNNAKVVQRRPRHGAAGSIGPPLDGLRAARSGMIASDERPALHERARHGSHADPTATDRPGSVRLSRVAAQHGRQKFAAPAGRSRQACSRSAASGRPVRYCQPADRRARRNNPLCVQRPQTS
jgi:hypothetical protein